MAEAKTKQPEKEIIYVPVSQTDSEDEIDLIELWSIIWKRKWFIMGFTALCTLVAVYVALFVLPITYQSNAVLQPTETGDNQFSQLSSLAANLPIPINLPGGGDKSLSIISFLRSRTLKIRLIEEHDLLPRLYDDSWNAEKKEWIVNNSEDIPNTILALQEEKLKQIFTVIQDSESMLITIAWVDKDPEFASYILEQIIKKLNYYLENEYESDAKRERIFVEKLLQQTEAELEYWEKQIPSKQLILSKIQRERLTTQSVYTELRKQLELAKISEVKEVVRFKILDKPFIPVEKFGPKRTIICSLTLVGSGFLIILMTLGYHFIKFKNLKSKN